MGLLILNNDRDGLNATIIKYLSMLNNVMYDKDDFVLTVVVVMVVISQGIQEEPSPPTSLARLSGKLSLMLLDDYYSVLNMLMMFVFSQLCGVNSL